MQLVENKSSGHVPGDYSMDSETLVFDESKFSAKSMEPYSRLDESSLGPELRTSGIDCSINRHGSAANLVLGHLVRSEKVEESSKNGRVAINRSQTVLCPIFSY